MSREDRISIQHASRLLQLTRPGNRAIRPRPGSVICFRAAEDSGIQLVKYVTSVTQPREPRPVDAECTNTPPSDAPAQATYARRRFTPTRHENRGPTRAAADSEAFLGHQPPKFVDRDQADRSAVQTWLAVMSATAPNDPPHPSRSPLHHSPVLLMRTGRGKCGKQGGFGRRDPAERRPGSDVAMYETRRQSSTKSAQR
jgi:hypothetical protein